MKKTQSPRPPSKSAKLKSAVPAKRPARQAKKDSILELARVIFNAIVETKALDVKVLDVRQKTSFADYLVIASGTNTRQVQAIVDRIDDSVSKTMKRNPLSIEGLQNANWVLIDYGDIVCHIFLDEMRDFYRLEDLWHEAKAVKFRPAR